MCLTMLLIRTIPVLTLLFYSAAAAPSEMMRPYVSLYFQLFQLPAATDNYVDVCQSFKKLARTLHPDKNLDSDGVAMQRLLFARDQLELFFNGNILDKGLVPTSNSFLTDYNFLQHATRAASLILQINSVSANNDPLFKDAKAFEKSRKQKGDDLEVIVSVPLKSLLDPSNVIQVTYKVNQFDEATVEIDSDVILQPFYRIAIPSGAYDYKWGAKCDVMIRIIILDNHPDLVRFGKLDLIYRHGIKDGQESLSILGRETIALTDGLLVIQGTIFNLYAFIVKVMKNI